MDRIGLIKMLNDYAVNQDTQLILDQLNEIFDNDNKNYRDYLDLIFISISITQMYGFLSYLNKEEVEHFLNHDYFRANSYSGNNVPFYNSGQLSLLNEVNLHNKVFISAPTSFGKTSMINDYLLRNYEQLNQVVYIVPTKSLLEELYLKFSIYNNELKLNYNASTQPLINQNERNLLILTPERFMLLLEEIEVSFFDLIVMDETYKIVDFSERRVSDFINNRAVRFRKVADLIGLSKNKVVFLSPFTYQLSESMSKFLSKYNIEKIDRKLQYVKHEVFLVESSKDYTSFFKESVRGYTKSSNISKKVSLLLNKLQDQRNIVYIANYSSGYSIVEQLNNYNFTVPENERYNAFMEHLYLKYLIDENSKWKVISGLEQGVGIYISPMPRYIKKEIIKLFEEGVLHTLLVTTSFTEGVNTNAKNLIFTSLVNGPNTKKLSDIDILNVAGRAGRFARSSIGRIICINSEIYNQIKSLQDTNSILLENYNYSKSNEKRIDYEIDMIDQEFLSDEEKEEKRIVEKKMDSLQLNKNDLKISLNVSNIWKLMLYKNFSEENPKYIQTIYSQIKNIISNEHSRRISSIEFIFKYLNKHLMTFEVFPTRPFDIKPFDSNGNFIWGRLYQIYLSGSIKKVISSNITYVTSVFNEVRRTVPSYVNKKQWIEHYFNIKNMGWILRYYNADLTLNFDAFYSEAFKFISNIIQYKIPFYLTFFISIFKLYIKKNNITCFNLDEVDSKVISILFEEGNIDQNYSGMIDFGLPNELINVLIENDITINDLNKINIEPINIDCYEKILIQDYLKITE